MAKTVATIAFIGMCAVIAVYLARRPTMARGDVLAAQLKEAMSDEITGVQCEDSPIGRAGARFWCRFYSAEGFAGASECWLNRSGRIGCRGM